MDEQTSIDPKDLRNVLGHVPTGVTVITAKTDERVAGATIGSFVSISLDPPLVGFFLDVNAGSWEVFKAAESFCVNVLSDEQTAISNVMAGRGDAKFDGLEFDDAPVSGAPRLAGTVATVDCELERVELLGDHYLVVGLVRHLEVGDGSSLLFYKGQYGSYSPVTSS